MEQGRLVFELQNHLQEKYKLQKNTEIAGMAQKLKELQLSIKKAEDEALKNQDIITGMELKAQETEKRINTLNGQIKAGKDKLYGAKGNGLKELLSMQQNLAKMEEDMAKSETQYWEFVRQGEELKEQSKQIREMVKALKSQYNEGVRNYKVEKSKLEVELVKIQLKEEEVTEKLKPEVLRLYKETERRYPLNPVALMKGGNCSGCHISIPSMLAMRVREGKVLCYCDNCGRILINP